MRAIFVHYTVALSSTYRFWGRKVKFKNVLSESTATLGTTGLFLACGGKRWCRRR